MSAGQIPHNEAPILVQYLQRQDHYNYDQSNTTAEERRPLEPPEVWLDAAAIPASPPAQTVYPGTASGVVSGISGVVLTEVPGDAFRFESLAGHLLNMVPANYFGDAYRPTLRDATGKVVPYNPSVWVADGLRRVVEFKYATPAASGYVAPFTFDYWTYTGLFPGGIGGAINLGAAAQILKVPVVPPTLEFRTLRAGPGLSSGQDVPTVGEVMISADEVTPAGAPAVPLALDLYVSALGNDTTGAGTPGSPYATLQRAFRDIRVIGYNSTATVTILASGGTFALPSGVLPLGQGSRGARAQPVIVQGSGRTTLNAALAVSAVTQDPASGLIDISVGAPPGVPFALGQIVSFTSGPLSAFQPVPAFPPAPVECFVAAVVSPTTIRIPFALGLPAIGNTFATQALDTVTTVTGITVLRSARLPIIFRNMRVDLVGAGGQGTLVLQGALFGLVGVWLRNTAPFGQLINVAGQIGVGRGATVLSMLSYTALGMYIDNTAPGGAFFRNSLDFQASIGFANSVFRGNGTPGNFTIGGALSTLTECYAEDTATIGVDTGVCQGQFLWFRNSVADFGRGALEAQIAGAFAGGNVRVEGSTGSGVHAGNGGELMVSTATISGCAGPGFLCDRYGIASTGNLTLASNAGTGLTVEDGGRLQNFGDINATGASTGSHGISVARGAVLITNGINSSNNFGDGLRVEQTASVFCGNAVTCSTNGGRGVTVFHATLEANTVTADTNGSDGVGLSDAATLSCSDLTAGANVFQGVSVRSASSLEASGTVTLNANTFRGLDAAEGSTLALGSVGASSNGQDGVSLVSRATLRAGDATLFSNAGNGLFMDSSAVASFGNMTVNNNAQLGVAANDSDLTAFGLTAHNNINGPGASFNRSIGRFNGTVDLLANGVLFGNQLSVFSASQVTVAGDVTDPGPSPGTSISVSDNSSLSIGGNATSANPTEFGLNVRTGSRVVVGGVLSLTACGSGTAAAFISEGSDVRVGVLTTTANANNGFLLLSGSRFQTPNVMTCSNNIGPGFNAFGSTVDVAGAVCDANGAAGIQIDGGTIFRAGGTLDCGANATHGIVAQNGAYVVTQGLTSSAGPNAVNGLTARVGARVQTAQGNTLLGAAGDVVVGVNAPVTWATIDTRAPAVVTDYLAAQPATEFCSVTA